MDLFFRKFNFRSVVEKVKKNSNSKGLGWISASHVPDEPPSYRPLLEIHSCMTMLFILYTRWRLHAFNIYAVFGLVTGLLKLIQISLFEILCR